MPLKRSKEDSNLFQEEHGTEFWVLSLKERMLVEFMAEGRDTPEYDLQTLADC